MLNTTQGLSGIAQYFIGIINTTIPVLITLCLVLFMFGALRYIYTQSEKRDRSIILWSLIALFVVVSVWGILRVMCTTLTSNASCQASR